MKEYDPIKRLSLTKRLCEHGCQKTLIRKLTNGTESFIKENYLEPEYSFRKGDEWLREKGGEKTGADRILRFLINCHGDDLSTLTIEADNLVELFEAFMVQYPRQIMSINRFYYFSLKLISSVYPIASCKSCTKPFVTENVRVSECGVCHDIERRVAHMKNVKRRRERARADQLKVG